MASDLTEVLLAYSRAVLTPTPIAFNPAVEVMSGDSLHLFLSLSFCILDYFLSHTHLLALSVSFSLPLSILSTFHTKCLCFLIFFIFQFSESNSIQYSVLVDNCVFRSNRGAGWGVTFGVETIFDFRELHRTMK